jgi:hypothetical protein
MNSLRPFRTLRAWWLRLGEVLLTHRREVELSAEIESHLQLHIDDNLRAGMTPAGARRIAHIKLGGMEQIKESYRDRRGIPTMESVVQDVRFGLRVLFKNPGFTAVAALTQSCRISTATEPRFEAVLEDLLRAIDCRWLYASERNRFDVLRIGRHHKSHASPQQQGRCSLIRQSPVECWGRGI